MPEPEEPTPNPDPTGQVFVAADDEPIVDGGEPQADGAARPSALRTATVVSGRIVLGVVIVAVIAIVLGAATLVRLPGVRHTPVSTVVTPVPTAQQLVCPGGLLRLGTTSGANATSASSLGSPQIASGATPGGIIPSDFAATDAGTGNTSAAPRLLTAPSLAPGQAAPALAGAQSQSVSTSEYNGLAAAACGSASGSTWLVGGATSVGRDTLVLLSNPTAVPATVALGIWGESGRVSAAGEDGIVVAPGAQRVLSLAGFAPGLVSPVVEVTSAGGQVLASLEQSTVRGVEPGGIDFVGGEAAPAESVVIPGVMVSTTAAIQSEIGQSGFDDLQSTLRMFVPGTKSATASITVIDEDGEVSGVPMSAKVVAGTVTDLPLTSLSDGSYTVIVSSRVPLVASVRVSVVGTPASVPADSSATIPSDGPADFAWVTGAPLLTANTVFSVAPDMTPALHLANPTAATETVLVHSLSGLNLRVTVTADSATTLPVAAGTTYELEGFQKICASVSGTTNGGITSYVVSPPAPVAGPLRVYG